MALLPRVVVVTRPTELELLVREHGTREQARFYASAQGRPFDELAERDARRHAAEHGVLAAIPNAWRRARVTREELPAFPFESDDVVVAVGQDGLVANVAKYLDGQPVIGINPDASLYEGILVRHAPRDAAELMRLAAEQRIACEDRTMVEAHLDDGQRIRALNEVFVGHRSHQSARYRLAVAGREESQSSSGLIVATGTGATGWVRSIAHERASAPALPQPCDGALVLLVREAFAAPGYGTALTAALVGGDAHVEVRSAMGEGGVVFGDGIEDDRLAFTWGRVATIRRAATPLRLVA
jgi:NAD kinase